MDDSLNKLPSLAEEFSDMQMPRVFAARVRSRRRAKNPCVRTDVLMGALNKLPSLAEESWEMQAPRVFVREPATKIHHTEGRT
jgi:hypothetical protein